MQILSTNIDTWAILFKICGVKGDAHNCILLYK